MQFIKVDFLVDALILVIHENTPEHQSLVKKIIQIFETDKNAIPTANEKDTKVSKLYISLLNDVMASGITVDDDKQINALILKFKSNPLLTSDAELFTTLKNVVTDKTPLDHEQKLRILQKLSNELILQTDASLVRRIFGRITNSSDDLNQQEALIREVSQLCSEIVKFNEEGISNSHNEGENTSRIVNFNDKNQLSKALKVYNTTAVTNKFKTGLQAMNRALQGGFGQGSSIVFASLSHQGKACRNGTPVLTPHGWTAIETLQVGDDVISYDGTVTQVTGVYSQGIRPIYMVTFIDDRKAAVDKDHLWTCTTEMHNAKPVEEWSVLTTEILYNEYSNHSTEQVRWYIPLYQGSKYAPDLVTNVDPYELGKQVAKQNSELPEEWLTASIRQKTALIRGFFDYGCLANRTSCTCDTTSETEELSFHVQSETLAKQIQQILWSLGAICTLTLDDDLHPYYTLDVVYTHPELLTTNSGHSANVYTTLGIKSIQPVCCNEATCITVTHPSKLFVIGDYVVTHNSLILMKMARWAVTLNSVTGNFSNPACIFYSLENEVPQNLVQLYREMYVNEHKVLPRDDVPDEEIVNYCCAAFNRHGWQLILERRLGSEFGFTEFTASFEGYVRAGLTPVVCIIDYVNLMAKGTALAADSTSTNNLAIQALYNNLCNFTKSRNCTLITAHQLNRKAAEVVRHNPVGAVTRFAEDMMADSISVRREVDILIYMNKEFDAAGNAYLTFKVDKHRYANGTPESDKYFAYPFFGEMGLLDDVHGQDMSARNIYGYDFETKRSSALGLAAPKDPVAPQPHSEHDSEENTAKTEQQSSSVTSDNGQSLNLWS